MGDSHNPTCEKTCRLSEEEREWIHTARKYIDSKHLPTLGKLLNMFENASLAIGKAVLMSIIIGGASLAFWWVFVKK